MTSRHLVHCGHANKSFLYQTHMMPLNPKSDSAMSARELDQSESLSSAMAIRTPRRQLWHENQTIPPEPSSYTLRLLRTAPIPKTTTSHGSYAQVRPRVP